MTGRIAWLAAAGFLALMTAASTAASAVDPQVARTLARLRADGATQTDFTPTPPPPPTPPSSPWLADFFSWLAGGGNGWVRALAYALIALVVLAVLYIAVPFVRDLVDRWLGRTPAVIADDAHDWRPDTVAARNLLAEADALAAAGRFAEAAHLLLGRSLEDVATRRPGLVKPALTARTIAAAGDIPAAARDALARIVAAVERSHWARRAIDAADWQAARASYEAFAFDGGWRGVAA